MKTRCLGAVYTTNVVTLRSVHAGSHILVAPFSHVASISYPSSPPLRHMGPHRARRQEEMNVNKITQSSRVGLLNKTTKGAAGRGMEEETRWRYALFDQPWWAVKEGGRTWLVAVLSHVSRPATLCWARVIASKRGGCITLCTRIEPGLTAALDEKRVLDRATSRATSQLESGVGDGAQGARDRRLSPRSRNVPSAGRRRDRLSLDLGPRGGRSFFLSLFPAANFLFSPRQQSVVVALVA